MVPCDRIGNWRVEVTDYGLVEEQSGSVAIALEVHLLEFWQQDADEPNWMPWGEYNMSSTGRIYVIKKDGTVNQMAAESLMRYVGWDGNFDSIANRTWEPKRFSCSIESNEYKGKVDYRIGFINDYERTPGKLNTVGADKAKELQARFGSPLRALAGSINRNASAPAGKPPAPPPPRQPAMANSRPMDPPPLQEGHIPFGLAVAMLGATASLLGYFA